MHFELSKNKFLFLFIYQHWQTFHKKVFQHEGGHLKIITKKVFLHPEKHEKSTRGLKICGTSYAKGIDHISDTYGFIGST